MRLKKIIFLFLIIIGTSLNTADSKVIHDFFSINRQVDNINSFSKNFDESFFENNYKMNVQNSNESDNCATSYNNPKINTHTFSYDPHTENVMIIGTEIDDRVILMIYPKNGLKDNSKNLKIHSGYNDDMSELNNNKSIEIKDVLRVFSSPFNMNYIILSCLSIDEEFYFLSTKDGGKNWNLNKPPFKTNKDLKANNNNYLLAKSTLNQLWISFDFSHKWLALLSNNVRSYEWSFNEVNNSAQIYFTKNSHEVNGIAVYDLYKILVNFYENKFKIHIASEIMKNVYSFGENGVYLFVSRAASLSKNELSDLREVYSSVDIGKNWEILPDIPFLTQNHFYAIIFVTDNNEIFIHVDENGYYGALYLSDSNGFNFKMVLNKHFYNFSMDKGLSDFQKIKSLPGAYLTSRFKNEYKIESLISFDGGHTWENLKTVCNQSMCNLQLHGSYSINKGVEVLAPISLSTVPGIVLAHGHIGDHLQIHKIDFYISIDGGHTWVKRLSGSHIYNILDYGSLIVAYQIGAHSFKYSFDYGMCWHYNSINKNYQFFFNQETMTSLVKFFVGINFERKELEVVSVNFKTVFKTKCNKTDYENLNLDPKVYCYNGMKPIFKRRIKNSVCYFGKDFIQDPIETFCKCEKSDYICDYGFKQNDKNCVFDENKFDKSMCVDKKVSNGYRKKNDTKCKGGYKPKDKINFNLFQQNCDKKSKLRNGITTKPLNLNVSSLNSHLGDYTNSNTFIILLIIGMVTLTLISILVIIWCFKKQKAPSEINYIKLDNSKTIDNSDAEDFDLDEKTRMLNQGKIVINNDGIFKK
jgi:hypothetical protein